MRIIVLSLIIWSFFIGTVQGQTHTNHYVIKNISLVDLEDDTVLIGYDVVIRDSKITEVYPTGSKQIPEQYPIMKGEGKYLLPGLIDSHVHLREPDIGLPVYIGFGVTTIRVMEGSEKILDLKRKVSNQNLLAPGIVTSTPYIEDLIKPETDIRRLISSLKDEGYDMVKIHDDIPELQYEKLIEAVRSADMKLVGHAQRDKQINYILQTGQHEISHGEEFLYTYFDNKPQDTEHIDNLVERVAATNTVIVPNIVFFKGMYQQATDHYFEMISDPDLIYVSAGRRHDWITDSHRFYIDNNELPWYRNSVALIEKLTIDFHRAGVPILAGSDTPLEFMIPGKSLLQELYNFADLGFSPADAIKTATVDAADFMELDNLGHIKPGYQADLLVLDSNPLDNIRNIEKLNGVFLRGKWYPKTIIEEQLNKISNDYHKDAITLNARQTAMNLFTRALENGNADSLISAYQNIDNKTSYSLLGESELNSLGYDLLAKGNTAVAIQVFTLNTQLYPHSANVWDSLGEAYWKNGNISKAIESYKKALQINPQFENPKRALDELQNQKQ